MSAIAAKTTLSFFEKSREQIGAKNAPEECNMIRIVSFYNRKGGVGKSSLCFLTARYLARTGQRVLVLDLDPQKTISSHFMRLEGFRHEPGRDPDAFSLMLDKHAVYEAAVDVKENIRLVPGSYDMSEIQSNVSVFRVQEALDPASEEYDFCLIDNAPNWSALIQSALFASGLIVIPALPAIEDMEQAQWSLIRAAKVSKGVRRIVLNQHSARPGRVVRTLLRHYEPYFRDFLLESWIPQSGLVRRYTGTGEEINSFARSKRAFMKCFSAFVNETMDTRLIPEGF